MSAGDITLLHWYSVSAKTGRGNPIWEMKYRRNDQSASSLERVDPEICLASSFAVSIKPWQRDLKTLKERHIHPRYDDDCMVKVMLLLCCYPRCSLLFIAAHPKIFEVWIR